MIFDLTKDDDHMRPVADASSQDHRAIDVVPFATVPGSQHRPIRSIRSAGQAA
jgi:hypothetical protein